MNRDEAITRIRKALKARSGKTWSVKGGRGTAWGWIKITSPPARSADQWGTMTDAEREELGRLIGEHVHHQGVSIPASSAFYALYVERAETGQSSVIANQYWD